MRKGEKPKITSLASALLVSCLTGAVLTASAKPVAYAVFDDGVLTFSYGEKPEGDNVYGFASGGSVPWSGIASQITKAVFDESMDGYKVASTAFYKFFQSCANLTSVEGLGRLDVSGISQINNTFAYCAKLEEVDFSRWVISGTKLNMSDAFINCTGLKKIYVSEKFNPTYEGTTGSPFRFSEEVYACAGLTGGNGTKWSKSYMGYQRAFMDRADQPGYFTGRTWIDVDLAGGEGVEASSYDLTTDSIQAPQVVHMGMPVRRGYVFTGWQIPSEQVEAGVTCDPYSGNITIPAGYLKAFSVTAQWESSDICPITYCLGSVRYEDQIEFYDGVTTHVLGFTNPVVSVGMKFTGWYDAPSCAGDPLTEIPAGDWGNKVLYAGEEEIGPTTLVWRGAVNDDWLNGRNWEAVGIVPQANKVPTANDVITFDGQEVGPVQFYGTVNVRDFVLAGGMTISATNDYTLSRVICGTGTVTKVGASNLTFSAANTYTGVTVVAGGTLTRSNIQAFGPVGNVVVVTNATVNLGGYANKNLNYDFVLDEGAVLDYSGNLQSYSGVNSVTLRGNATFYSGTDRTTPPNPVKTSIILDGHTLSKTGVGTLKQVPTIFSTGDSGVLHVREGTWMDVWKDNNTVYLSDFELWVDAGGTYYESQNLRWGRIRAENESTFSLNTNYRIRVQDRILGGMTAARVTVQNGSIYEPLAIGDKLDLGSLLDSGNYGPSIVLDVSNLKDAVPNSRIPLISVLESEPKKPKVTEVLNSNGKPWPVYTETRDGYYVIGVTAKNGGILLLVR